MLAVMGRVCTVLTIQKGVVCLYNRRVAHTARTHYNLTTPLEKTTMQPDSVDAVIRILWPYRPYGNLSRALNTPYWTVRNWVSGYRAIPAEKILELSGIFARRMHGLGLQLEDIARESHAQYEAKLTVTKGKLKPASKPQPVRL